MKPAPAPTVLVYGCGKMGEAILAGWLASDAEPVAAWDASSFLVLERTSERARSLEEAHGVRTVEQAREAAGADIVLLAVKPQSFDEVLATLSDALLGASAQPLIVSIAAGVTTSTIEEALGNDARVVRVMPNLPLQAGAGASAVCGGANATPEDIELVRGMFAALGFADVVEERLIDVVCAISGGGPAYFVYLCELLADAGEQAGLERGLAMQLATSTLVGTGRMLAESQIDAAELRRAVCSPGGTTLAALFAMDEHGIKDAVQAGVMGAVARAEELSRC